MKQRYKYRAKMLDKPDTWVYGGYYEYDENAVILHVQGINTQQHTAVDPSTVGQCTGLKDQSYNVYIYQGDNILWKNKIWEVEWNDDYAGYVIYRSMYTHGENQIKKLDCDIACESQVIGTIHDNETE